CAGGGMGNRQHRVADVLLEPRRPYRGRHPAHRRAARPDRPMRRIEFDTLAGDFQPDELLLDPRSLDAPQRIASDVVCLLIVVHQALEADFINVVGERHVSAPIEDTGLDTPDIGRPGWTDVVRAARVHDAFPQLVATAAVPQIDLVAYF